MGLEQGRTWGASPWLPRGVLGVYQDAEAQQLTGSQEWGMGFSL
jgi:hypothetical protein